MVTCKLLREAGPAKGKAGRPCRKLRGPAELVSSSGPFGDETLLGKALLLCTRIFSLVSLEVFFSCGVHGTRIQCKPCYTEFMSRFCFFGLFLVVYLYAVSLLPTYRHLASLAVVISDGSHAVCQLENRDL